MVDYCKNYSVLMTASDGRNRVIYRASCNSWDCDYCGAKLARMWRAHTLDNINRLSDDSLRWAMVTVTGRGGNRTTASTLKNVQTAWRGITELWRQYHQRLGLPIPEYLRVYEQHADGTVHLHAIVQSALPLENIYVGKQRRNPSHKGFSSLKFKRYIGKHLRIKDIAASFGGGYQADVSPFLAANAGIIAAYVTKYMTKDIQASFEVDKRVRRIQTSSGFSAFGENKRDSSLVWESVPHLTFDEFAKENARGIVWDDLNKNHKVGIHDFTETMYYPPMSDKV